VFSPRCLLTVQVRRQEKCPLPSAITLPFALAPAHNALTTPVLHTVSRKVHTLCSPDNVHTMSCQSMFISLHGALLVKTKDRDTFAMKSCIRCNVQFLSERYQLCTILPSSTIPGFVRHLENSLDLEVPWQARLVDELVMVRDGFYRLIDDYFLLLDICQAIVSLCTE